MDERLLKVVETTQEEMKLVLKNQEEIVGTVRDVLKSMDERLEQLDQRVAALEAGRGAGPEGGG